MCAPLQGEVGGLGRAHKEFLCFLIRVQDLELLQSFLPSQMHHQRSDFDEVYAALVSFAKITSVIDFALP